MERRERQRGRCCSVDMILSRGDERVQTLRHSGFVLIPCNMSTH